MNNLFSAGYGAGGHGSSGHGFSHGSSGLGIHSSGSHISGGTHGQGLLHSNNFKYLKIKKLLLRQNLSAELRSDS